MPPLTSPKYLSKSSREWTPGCSLFYALGKAAMRLGFPRAGSPTRAAQILGSMNVLIILSIASVSMLPFGPSAVMKSVSMSV